MILDWLFEKDKNYIVYTLMSLKSTHSFNLRHFLKFFLLIKIHMSLGL